jgi:radical SAM superfamily enzyme YgiQ (UPF0313 family)
MSGARRDPRRRRVLLVSTYELGRQPLEVAEAAARLRAAGHDVRAVDLAVEPWDPAVADWADVVAAAVPMHTATRLAREVLAGCADRPRAAFGLYAEMAADVAVPLAGRDALDALVRWVDAGGNLEGTDPGPAPDGGGRGPAGRPSDPAADRRGHRGAVRRRERRLPPLPPARDLLPPPARYARLVVDGEERLAGSLAASWGCTQRCRHCPVPVVWDGRTRVNPVERVLADAAQQVAQGVRHFTFADPDFLSGPHHARRVVDALHGAFPEATFDVTTKVSHVLAHAGAWPAFARAGCLFVTSAFEHTNDRVLALLDKGHTAADLPRAVEVLRRAGITVRPSWLPFTPWSRPRDVTDILDATARLGLVGDTDPVQHTIRLLLLKGSLLLPFVPDLGPWDDELLGYRWASPLDPLQRRLAALVEAHLAAPPGEVHDRLRAACGLPPLGLDPRPGPRLSEAWFCCAEPTAAQRAAVRVPTTAP